MKRLLVYSAGSLALAAGAAAAPPGALADASWADRAYLQAVQLLQGGRPAEACGRIMALANAGHPETARLAMVMWQHGLRHSRKQSLNARACGMRLAFRLIDGVWTTASCRVSRAWRCRTRT